MKVTLDLPDNVLAAVTTIVVNGYPEMRMTTQAIPTSELKDGAVFDISIAPPKGENA